LLAHLTVSDVNSGHTHSCIVWHLLPDVNSKMFVMCVQATVVNRELVHRGLARWLEMWWDEMWCGSLLVAAVMKRVRSLVCAHHAADVTLLVRLLLLSLAPFLVYSALILVLGVVAMCAAVYIIQCLTWHCCLVAFLWVEFCVQGGRKNYTPINKSKVHNLYVFGSHRRETADNSAL